MASPNGELRPATIRPFSGSPVPGTTAEQAALAQVGALAASYRDGSKVDRMLFLSVSAG